VNPVFVAADAARSRPDEIARGVLGSVTTGAGQLCTKPGLLLVPADSTVPDALARVPLPPAAPLLHDRGTAHYLAGLRALLDHHRVTVLHGDGFPVVDPPPPVVLGTELSAVLAEPEVLFQECFGPLLLVATYADEAELLRFARRIDGQLTATLVADRPSGLVAELARVLAGRVGRLLWNQWPTGVAVTHAQQHGGPYPATTAPGATSVGTAAIARFLRPVAYQNFPPELLPPDLRDLPGESGM
jgi:NADP-dependent aldehyde dehydrogenase